MRDSIQDPAEACRWGASIREEALGAGGPRPCLMSELLAGDGYPRSIPTAMARVPIEEGFFRIPDDPAEPPRLLGSRCPACGEVFFPRRLVCAKCLHEGTEDTELSTQGTIHTWTYCHVPLFGKKDAAVAGYGVAQVDLPEGPRVQSILSGGRDQFAIGTTVELDLETLRQNSEGDDVVIYRFRPVPGGNAA
jgi:uncharacterized protein